jgi:Asp-tRNA(Asn)/Glu-tRNA(Gln) amidotransferase B subunit
MSRKLVSSFAMLAALAFAASAGAHEYRFFNGSDRVYYQRYDRMLERVQEPHIHLARAERAFAKGHRSYAAENLEQAAVGFDYFSERAAGEDRRQLDLAKRALEKLARDVRRGDVDEVTTLERALSDARRVLAGEAVMETPAAAPAAPAQS